MADPVRRLDPPPLSPGALDPRTSEPPMGGGPFGIVEFAQLAAFSNKSVRMLIRDGEHRVGEVQLWQGVPWTALDLEGEGIEALVRLVCADDLKIEVEPLTLERRKRQTLMDGHSAFVDALDAREAMQATLVPDRSGIHLSAPPDESQVVGRTFYESIPPVPIEQAEAEHDQRVAERAQRSFAELVEQGLEAMIDRRLEEALELFRAADRLAADPSVQAKIERLEAVLGQTD